MNSNYWMLYKQKEHSKMGNMLLENEIGRRNKIKYNERISEMNLRESRM